MEAGSRARLATLALAASTAIGLACSLVLGASAATGGTVTVCPSGPQACDHGTIQAGIDAAGAGDTVLVFPGVYTEQVTPRSSVMLASRDGAEVTTITASEGPVVTGTHVASATV
jgi:pectin methylesterase-like acyl-CoA thioesterase